MDTDLLADLATYCGVEINLRKDAPQSEHTLAWDDPAVGITWPDISMAPLVSDKDARGSSLADAAVFA